MPTPKNAPLYQQIYDEIKDAIEKGVYAPKERIPSELELAEQYDCLLYTSSPDFAVRYWLCLVAWPPRRCILWR